MTPHKTVENVEARTATASGPQVSEGRSRTGTTRLDPKALKKRFPILAQQVHGKPLVYLDNAASSQKPDSVIEAIAHYYRHDHANVHRGAYELSIRATDLYEQARARVARFIGAGRADEIVFTRSTTEAINLVAYAWGRANLGPGEVVVVTEMEHHSNLVPWHLVAGMTGARVEAVRMTDDGLLDLDSLDEILARGRVKLVTTAHVSNAIGTIHPIEEIARRAHAAGALYLIDGAQAAPHAPVDVRAIGCDFYALSGHKMCGPTGIGALWGRKELLESMPPFNGGGEMIDEVHVDRSTYAKPPRRFEAGTPHIAGAVGLAAAIEFLESVGMEAVARHEAAMARLALERLAEEFPAIRLYGPGPQVPRAGVLSFTLADIHPHDLATILDHEGVAIRAGHHCCQPLMRHYGIAATARASFYLYNDEDDLEALVRALHRGQEIFGIA
jgi:cysteine desulfurase/selenocysteine lyase